MTELVVINYSVIRFIDLINGYKICKSKLICSACRINNFARSRYGIALFLDFDITESDWSLKLNW